MILGKYNQSKTITFDLIDLDGVDMSVAATFAAGDVKIMKDEGVEANTTNLPTDEGSTYSLVLTATEMSAARIRIVLIDQTATKVWLDISLGIETYGHASAEHAFDLDTATVALSATGLDAIASTAIGMVEIAKAIWDRVLTGATHNIATSSGRRLRGIQEFQGYEGGAVWVDTVNGAAGTIDYENGTVENPVLSWADALTLATSLGFTRFEIVNGSTITLAATLSNSVLKGDKWNLALGGQNTSGSHFEGANVSGTNSGTQAHFEKCSIGTVSLSLFHIENSSFNGTITLLTAGDYLIADSHSSIAGATTPVIDTGAVLANINLSMRRHSGGVEIQNLNAAGVDNFSIEGVGQIIYAASSSGTVNQRGDWKVTNTGGVTITADDNTTNLGIITDVDGVILGAAGVDLIMDEPLTGGTHNVANSLGKRIRDLQEWGSYEGGAIFIDTVNGAAGTTDYESGTMLNPVNTIADANTLAASLGIGRFAVAPASNITFAASQVGQVFRGIGWSIALGGQDISNSEIIGAQLVTGIAITPTGEVHFVDCELVNGTLGQAHLKFCGLGGTLILSAAANYTISNCYSQIPGSPTPIIDFGAAVGVTGLSMRHYSGGIEIQNYGVTGADTMSIEGNGQLVINANCTGGTIYVRGNFKVTNNSGGAVTVVYDDNTANIISILADTNELQTDWVDGGRLDNLLDAAASAGDPWITPLPGAYAAGTAGKIIGDNINAPLDVIDGVVDSIKIDTASGGIPKNAIFNDFEFPMVLTSDHYTAAVSKTVTCQRSIDGGAFGNATGTVAEVGSGVYQIDLTAADTNGDVITYKFSATDCDDTIITITTRS